MPVKGEGRLGRQLASQPSANFEPLPAAYLRECAKVLKDDAWIAVAEEKRSAKIRKGKADASGSCKARTAKGERLVPIRFTQYSHTGGAVKYREVGMGAGEAIPTRIASGIDNAYLDEVVESP